MLEYMTENKARSSAVTRASHVPKQPIAQKDVSSSIYINVIFYNSLMNKDTLYH